MGRVKEYYFDLLTSEEEQELCEWIDKNYKYEDDEEYLAWLEEKAKELEDEGYLENEILKKQGA